MAASESTTRREFLKVTGSSAAALGLAGVVVPHCHAAEDSTIRLALVGCGGRGTGAVANAFSTTGGPVKLYAMADLFEHRLNGSLNTLSGRFADQVDVPPDRRFLGFDAYQKAIDCLGPGDVVLLTTHAAFRPMHLEYAVKKGVNVFAEKSFATDAPAARRWLKAAELSEQKNLKVGVGFMWRHSQARQEVIQRIHDGAIGDVHTLRIYRVHGPVHVPAPHRRPERTDLPAPAPEQLHLGVVRLLHRLALPQRGRRLLGQGRLAGGGPRVWRSLLRIGRQPVRPLHGGIHVCRRHEAVRLLAAHGRLLEHLCRLRPRLQGLGRDHDGSGPAETEDLQEPEHGARGSCLGVRW